VAARGLTPVGDPLKLDPGVIFEKSESRHI
jgi:hypothetical protein